MTLVNDVHSRLNPTQVASVAEVDSLERLREALNDARRQGWTIAAAGGRHAMGGQQFRTGGLLLDTRGLRRVLDLDLDRGLVEVEAGIQWPELVQALAARPDARWGIAQKQTGADRFTIGGSVSVNAHGRGLDMQPLVADVESLRLVRPDGSLEICSREENRELFGLAVGGYGLFGVIYAVTLRLVERRKLERVVELGTVDALEAAFRERIADGFLYGDFQFAIDERSDDFLRRGVFSCYRSVGPETPIPAEQRALTRKDWQSLLVLAHSDKARAFADYSRHYLATSGQIYWSDLHQLADYADGYHAVLDRALAAHSPATEMIGELYVPRARLADFMAACAEALRRLGVSVIYGTVRLVRRDGDTFLPWAKDDYACVIFNIHTEHTEEGLERSAAAFRGLIDQALERDGSFFLTYHRWATREQVAAAYPQFTSFLQAKRRLDPEGTFGNDWHTHYERLFADEP